MSGILLKEDNGKLLNEDLTELGQARKCDYKFSYIFNKGTTTDVLVRFYEGTGSYTRTAKITERLDTHQGSKTIEELRTYYNNQLTLYGTPIAQQT